MSTVDLSVIVPVYNSQKLVGRTIESILAQKTDYTYEIICIDDGSTDNSVGEIQKFGNDCIKIFKQKNAGPSAARNHGLNNANGRYVAFLDADDYWKPEFIEQTIKFLDTHNECVAVSVGQLHLSVSGEAIRPVCIDKYLNSLVLDDFFDFWADYNHVCTGSVVIRHDIVKAIGGFREDLLSNEDWEYWALVGSKGKWGFIPNILFTSDGMDVSRDLGWVQKMKPRWYNAQSVKFWKKRIEKVAPELNGYSGYKRKVGIIASDISLSLILSERENAAREEVKEYGRYFEPNLLSSLMKYCASWSLFWWALCKLIVYREYHRKI